MTNDPKPQHEQVGDLVSELALFWPLLFELREPGTRRRWQDRPSPARRLSVDRLERVAPSSAPSPAPVAVSVLDLISRVSTVAAEVGAVVADVAGVARLAGPSALVDPIRHLEHARSCLRAADEVDPRSSPWVVGVLAPVVQAVAQEVGEVRTGQTLRAVCPWCGGRSPASPHGGGRTLEVIVPDVDVDDDEPLIVCRGTSCSPPSRYCGRRWLGLPAWGEREWDWLAKQLRDLDDEPPAIAPPADVDEPGAHLHVTIAEQVQA